MRTVFVSITLLILFVGVSHATWQEFYMVTTGSNTNAGSGTGNSADVTSTNGNWGGSGTLNRFTAASGTPFSGVTVGSMASVYLDAAAAAVFISSVIAVNGGGASIDVDTTTIKWGTSPSTGTTGRSCKIGGAWADLGVVTSLFASGTAPLSTRINIKAGTYANTTTTRQFNMSGTATAPIWWRGYKTTIGDQDSNNVAVAGTDIPTLTFANAQMVATGNHQIFSNLDITSAYTSANGTLNPTSGSGNSQFYRIRVTNTAANVNSRAATFNGAASVIGCYFKATTTANNCVSLGTAVRFQGNIVTGGIIGVSIAATSLVKDCVLDSQAGDAIQVGTGIQAQIYNCSIYNPTGNGVNFTGTIQTGGSIVSNCYFENVNQAAKAAINNTSGTNTDLITVVGNAYFNCTLNTSGITESFAIFDNGTLATSAFTNPGSQDFSIKPVAKALGFPGKFENTSVYQGYLDVGAVQRQEKGFQGVFVQ